MKRFGVLILILIQISYFTSCLTTKDTNLLREPGGNIPNYSHTDAIGEYRIKPGDELYINITIPPGIDSNNGTEQLFSLYSARYGSSQSEDNKLRTVPVQPDGNIHFPYIGDLNVNGRTTLEIQDMMEQKLNDNIVKDCFVKVNLANRYFSVIGESHSGRYPIAKEQMTIYQALSQSLDIKPYGDRSKIKIVRQINNTTVIKTFDLRSEDVVNSEFYYIQPNDVIYIQPLKKEFWGINSFGGFFAVISTIASLGILIYNLTN